MESTALRDLTAPTTAPVILPSTQTGLIAPSDLTEFIERAFRYHPPKGNQQARYERLRDAARELAILINGNCPHSRERSLAITQLQSAIQWANASIAINE